MSNNNRILLVDDNPAIHEDFRKILGEQQPKASAFADAKALLFDDTPVSVSSSHFEIDSAYQGQEALKAVQKALAEGKPYAMAFVDVRMPPGWDGIETIQHIWKVYPELQVVICTAYSDYSWDDIISKIGQSDNLVILKKPFDNVEVLQLTHAMTKKWNLAQQAKTRMEDLDRLVLERTKALRSSEERFSKAFQSNPLPMAILDAQSREFADVNESFVKLTSYRADQLLGKTPAAIHLWENHGSNTEFFNKAVAAKSVRNLGARLRMQGGEVRDVLVFAELFNLEDRPFLLLLIQDITERLQLEGQLRQAQKMEAIGQLAAGVAHDFNNILTVIQGHISLSLTEGSLGQSLEKSLKQSLAASERAGTLTRQLLAFSRKQVMERKPIKMNRLFESVGPMLQRLIGEHIAIRFDCSPDVPPILGDPCNLEQVILNLAVNARDAMAQGGNLTITATRKTFDEASVHENPEASVGSFVCLEIRDTGCGMDEQTRKRAFEPFFTTKDVGKGTGMGLATVYGIVKQHQGWIELQSAKGHGTTFSIFLPVTNEQGQTSFVRKAEPPRSSTKGSETILVVEDEPFLQQFVQTVLEGQGYQVLLADNALAALEVWQSHASAISLLLTDMVMPGGVSGKELGERLKTEKPGLRVIYSSGYSLDVLGPDCQLAPGCSLLQKPYQANVLTTLVRHTLDGVESPRNMVNNNWTRNEVPIPSVADSHRI